MFQYIKKTNNVIKGTMIDDSSSVIQGKTIYINSQQKTNGVTTATFEDNIIDKIMKMLSEKQVVQHKCQNCGASLEIDMDNHLFRCGYCGSVYFIGTEMVNDK